MIDSVTDYQDFAQELWDKEVKRLGGDANFNNRYSGGRDFEIIMATRYLELLGSKINEIVEAINEQTQ